MANSPPLHIGWLLDVAGVPPPGVPVMLKASGLKSHTAIIAQSGSGKSFMLGRLLEEIAAKTEARTLILDPNSDFIKFSEVEAQAWTKPHLQTWFAADDNLEGFEKRWSTIGFDLLTNRESSSVGLTHANARITPISLSWGNLSLDEQASHLGISVANNPGELYALHRVHRHVEESWKEAHQDDSCYTLSRFWDYAAAIWAKTFKADERLFPETWPLGDVTLLEGEISSSAALSLYGRTNELLGFEIWDRVERQMSLPSRIRDLSDKGSGKKVLCLDLASLDKTEERLSVAHAALNALWNMARRAWLDAIKEPSSADTRYPTFIVIDEAHNLAPAEPTTTLARAVNETLVRIATEGRKYGLSLILVTQRPSRLDPSLLSQCDNLCLLKMNNRLDLELVENGFGFLPAGWSKRALEFKVGDALFSGNFIDRPVYAHVAPRRTAEGGRNLEDKFWLQDPLQVERSTAQEPPTAKS